MKKQRLVGTLCGIELYAFCNEEDLDIMTETMARELSRKINLKPVD